MSEKTSRSLAYIQHHGFDGVLPINAVQSVSLNSIIETDPRYQTLPYKYGRTKKEKQENVIDRALIDCATLPKTLHTMVGYIDE